MANGRKFAGTVPQKRTKHLMKKASEKPPGIGSGGGARADSNHARTSSQESLEHHMTKERFLRIFAEEGVGAEWAETCWELAHKSDDRLNEDIARTAARSMREQNTVDKP